MLITLCSQRSKCFLFKFDIFAIVPPPSLSSASSLNLCWICECENRVYYSRKHDFCCFMEVVNDSMEFNVFLGHLMNCRRNKMNIEL